MKALIKKAIKVLESHEAKCVEYENQKRQAAQKKRDFDRAAGKRNLAVYKAIKAMENRKKLH